jgi:3'-phosphoadenosine 5'-phosphosulfate sulfotransferase (PAPS reductase)/FAD synthetase
MKEPIIKTHKLLAEHIEGKTILHLCSLGKDASLCLEWLCNYAKPKKIVSVFFKFLAFHPGDESYLAYLKKRFPQVEFVVEPDAIELSLIVAGVYQDPIRVLKEFNHYEYVGFSREKQIEELKEKYQIDYVCNGASKYESFARRTKFHQKGLVFNGVIFPLGMFSKAEVFKAIKDSGLKLHPCYKFSGSGYDMPSYYKMRSGILASREYREKLLKIYPMLLLDFYRYEVLLKPLEEK